jgi:enoyl-CoA hydratase/carnithine racemase
MTAIVTTSRHGHVAEIMFSAPPYNYASVELLTKLADAMTESDADPEVRCMVLASEGKPFCGGADLAGDTQIVGSDGMDAIGEFYVQAERMFRRTKPMVAAVQGAAVGAGLGLALAADFRVAGPGARFACNFVRLGFHPGFAITHTLPRVVGHQRAGWMMLSAERVKPEDAYAWGLADRLAPEGETLSVAHAMAREIAANAPLALVSVRKTWLGEIGDTVAATTRHEHREQTRLKATDDYREGVASVFERRDARFTGQ